MTSKYDRMIDLEARLRKQGALQGTIDAFSAIVRELEDETLAGLIRRTLEARPEADRPGLATIANEIENFRN